MPCAVIDSRPPPALSVRMADTGRDGHWARRVVVAVCISGLMLLPACSPKVVGGYYVEHGKVYWTNGVDSTPREIAGADPDSFNKLGSGYAKDKTHAYYRGAEISGADVSTFEWMDHGWAKDRSHVWAGTQAISDDPGHFVMISGDVAKDRVAVYCYDREVSDDPAHFEIVKFAGSDGTAEYAKDSRNVYYRCQPIPDADPATFRRLNDSVFNYAVDAHRAYYQDRVVNGADPHTFRVLYDTANEGCAADDQHAYRWDTVIPDVVPRDFPANKRVTGCDATRVTFGP